MPELHIKRKKQLFAPLNCCFHVFIDDEKLTTLSNGDSDRLTIKEGKHTLKIRNNYFATRKIPFEINGSEVKEFETSSMPILAWLYFFAPVILIIVATLKFFHISMSSYVFPLALIPLLLFIILALVLGVFKKAILLKGIQ